MADDRTIIDLRLADDATRLSIINRMALRVLPLYLDDESRSLDRVRQELILSHLHCCVIGATFRPNLSDRGYYGEIARRSISKVRRVSSLSYGKGFGPSDIAQAVCGEIVDGGKRSISSIFKSLDSFLTSSGKPFDFREEIARDIAAANFYGDITDGILWRIYTPPWFNENWNIIKKSLSKSNKDWDHWTYWFDCKINGLENPRIVQDRLISITDEYRGASIYTINHAINMSLTSVVDKSEGFDIAQMSGPYSMYWREGWLEAAANRGEAKDSALAGEMLEAILEVALYTRSVLMENLADAPLKMSIDRLIEDLCAGVRGIRIGRLQISLRIIQGYESAYAGAGNDANSTVLGLLKGLSGGLLDLASQFKAVQAMEASRVALQVAAREDIAPLLKPVAEMVDIARTSPVVGVSVVEALMEGDEEVRVLTEQVNDIRLSPVVRAEAINKRSNIVGQKLLTVWNFGAEAVSWSRIPSVVDAAGEGVKNGVRKGVEDVVGGSIKGLAASLAIALGQPMIAISLLVETFKPLAKRTTEEKERAQDHIEQQPV